MERNLPTGTVTMLFTDIEGSTGWWESDPESMRAALARHDRILREAIEDAGGYVFSTAGDAFCAAFDRPAAAAKAAIDVQTTLAEQRWPARLDIRVRIGLHTGTADERSGDYFGPTPNRCARITAAAHGGQVLMSSATAELLRGKHAVRDVGAYVLKGVTEPMHLHQLLAAGLGDSFPPVAALPANRTNLPDQRDRFVGRVDDVERLIGHLDDHQLVTVTAVGGTGKTRLALQAAAEMAGRYPDGVWFVELSAMEPDETVAASIGAAVGFDVREGSDWLTTAADWLSVKDILVVLDNCEHVIEDAARTTEAVLDAGRGVRILATSREPLGVRGEAVVRLAPLDPRADGRELFVDRARAADDRFDVEGREEEIAELCQHLDGLPLAIELAAAHVRTLQPAEMLELLDRRFELLRSRDRSTEERHRTVRGAIEWSYELLSEDAQRLLDRLSVFLGSFDADAAAAIADRSLDRFEVFALIEELEAKSLLESRVSGDRTRYHLLETVAAFGREQLRERGIEQDVLARHATFFIDSTASTIEEIRSLDPRSAARRVPDVVNAFEETRRALRRAAREQPERALEVAVELSVFLASMREMRTAATLRAGVLDELAPADPSGFAHAVSAVLGVADYDVDRIAANAQAALAVTGSPRTRALAFAALAWSDLVMNADREAGIEHVDEALVELEMCDDTSSGGIVGPALVVMCHHAGERERAREVFESFVEPQRSVVPLWELAVVEAAASAYRFTDLGRSTAHVRAAIELAELARLTGVRSIAQYLLGLNHMRAHDDDAAFHALVTCLPGLLDTGEAMITALALEDLAAVLAEQDRVEEAVVCLAAGVAEGARRRASGPAVYGARRSRIRTRAEQELGEAGFADAWRRGRSMTLDAATAWATRLDGCPSRPA